MKKQLATQIRTRVGLEQQHKTFFTKEEIKQIVKAIRPRFKFESVPYDTVLSTVVKGWQSQKTIERHPTVQNMSAILKQLDKKPYRLQELTHHISRELMGMAKSVKLNRKVLTLTLK